VFHRGAVGSPLSRGWFPPWPPISRWSTGRMQGWKPLNHGRSHGDKESFGANRASGCGGVQSAPAMFHGPTAQGHEPVGRTTGQQAKGSHRFSLTLHRTRTSGAIPDVSRARRRAGRSPGRAGAPRRGARRQQGAHTPSSWVSPERVALDRKTTTADPREAQGEGGDSRRRSDMHRQLSQYRAGRIRVGSARWMESRHGRGRP
jgi:hypothetical protein